MRVGIKYTIAFEKSQLTQGDLRGFKKYPSTTMTPQIPPFANDIGANKLTMDLAYLTLKYKD